MFTFWRNRKFEDSQLGRFRRVRTMWYQVVPPAGLGVSVEGGRECPLPEGIEIARGLLRDPDASVQAATDFIRADARALKFMEGRGDLICDGFTVYKSGRFAVEFSLKGWPDAMITVPFEEGAPCDILLGD
jgi:hypothetical protein